MIFFYNFAKFERKHPITEKFNSQNKMMKKFFSINFLLAFTFLFLTISCGKKENKDQDIQTKISRMIARSDSLLPNYRYVDLDTILSRYNLAKDYNEEMLRMQSTMQNEVKKHENNLQSKAAQMQNKLQNNGYLSEASLQSDQRELADEQNKAQRAVAALQNNFETKMMLAQKAVNDSIETFIYQYNMQKGYDAIFFKAATIYINPALDITDEVIEGLNARYNKVK